MKFKKQRIISIDTEKAFENPTPFHDTNTKNVGIQGNFLNMIRSIYEKLTANLIFNDKRLKAYSLSQEQSRMFTFSTAIQHHLGSPSQNN